MLSSSIVALISVSLLTGMNRSEKSISTSPLFVILAIVNIGVSLSLILILISSSYLTMSAVLLNLLINVRLNT